MSKKSKSVLGSNYLNPNGPTTFGGNPAITNNFLNETEYGNFEGETPPECDFKIGKYDNIVYKINRDGIVKGQNGEEIKPLIRDEISYVTLRSKNGKSRIISVLSLMDKIFGKYFPGYSKKCKKPSKYKLVPKDGDYTNLKYNNLEYVDIYKYTKIGIVRTLLKWGIEDNIIINGCEISKNKLRKFRNDMQKEGYEDLIKGLGIKMYISLVGNL